MAWTKKIHSHWPAIPADSVDPVGHWLQLVSAETRSTWLAKAQQMVAEGKMYDAYSIEVTPQEWERLMLDQAACDEWIAFVNSRLAADGLQCTLTVTDYTQGS